VAAVPEWGGGGGGGALKGRRGCGEEGAGCGVAGADTGCPGGVVG
jgi:hypothetical protein